MQAFVVLPSGASPVQRSRAGSSCDFGRSQAVSSANIERPSGATLAGAESSSSQVEQFRAPWRSRASSSGQLERPSGAERARAAISSAPAEPSGFDVGNVGMCGHFEPAAAPGRARAAISSQMRLRADLDRPFRAMWSSGPARNVGRCGVFELGRAELSPANAWRSKRSCGNFELDILS